MGLIHFCVQKVKAFLGAESVNREVAGSRHEDLSHMFTVGSRQSVGLLYSVLVER